MLRQRINDIEREYDQKYNEAKEQLKYDPRLTVDEIGRVDKSNEWNNIGMQFIMFLFT